MPLLATAAGDDAASPYSLKLVKATKGPNDKKPAELFFNRDGAANNTLLNAAILLRDIELPGRPGVLANAWGLSAGVAKNTLGGKRSDMRTFGAALESRWTFSQDKASTLDTRLNADFDDDHEPHAKGHSLVLGSTLRSKHLHLDPQLGPGQAGVDAWLYPSVGLYQRRVSSTADAAALPTGSHSGAFVGAHVTARLVWVFPTPDVPLFDRLSLDIVTLYTRDASVSGGYQKAGYRFAEVSLDYLLYGPAAGTGWKPMISVTRTRGTNRPGNESHEDKSSIGFKLSYGI